MLTPMTGSVVANVSVMLATSSVTTAPPVDVQWIAVDMVLVVQEWNVSV